MPLMRDTDAQVTRLVELHADDAALRASGPESLATALVLLATAGDRPEWNARRASAGHQAIREMFRDWHPSPSCGRSWRRSLGNSQ